MNLRRFWFPIDGHLGIGVTAPSLQEAATLAEALCNKHWPGEELGVPLSDVDVGQLDQKHVVPNMGSPAVRGIWFPLLNV
jgi:hypothetical protein